MNSSSHTLFHTNSTPNIMPERSSPNYNKKIIIFERIAQIRAEKYIYIWHLALLAYAMFADGINNFPHTIERRRPPMMNGFAKGIRHWWGVGDRVLLS